MLIKLFLILTISITVSYSQNSIRVKELTKQIINENDNDSIKLIKISKWITNNIKFNTKAFKTNEILTCEDIIKKKLATNRGYSNLFAKMLDYAKIKNSKITGYYKGLFYEKNDKLLRANHMWNAVLINGKWQLFDITLASGYLQNTSTTNANTQKLKWVKSYNKDMLFTDINYFKRTHMPLQKYWQLTNTPITITEFEQNIFTKKKYENYDYIKQINANYVKNKKLKNILKNYDIGFKENPYNVSLIGLKYNKQAINLFQPIKKRSVSNDTDYKKTIAKINNLNKQASMQFTSHIRNVKKKYKLKATKNKTFSIKNTKQINTRIKTTNQNIAKRQKIIEQLNKKNEIFLSLIETYEKNKINDKNKVVSIVSDISAKIKLAKEYNEIRKILYTIKQIDTDTIKYKIKSINVLEDSVSKMLNYSLNYEKQKTNFINNFSFNRLSIYNNINDSLELYNKIISELVNEFNSNVDTSYFNIETSLTHIVKLAETHYKKAKIIIISKKMENSIFALLNNTIDSVYYNAQLVLKANISSFKPMIKNLNKDYFSINKNILSELENQQKTETERHNNFDKYYNELLNQEISLFNSFIKKSNKRITKLYDDYRKEAIEPIDEIKLLFIE